MLCAVDVWRGVGEPAWLSPVFDSVVSIAMAEQEVLLSIAQRIVIKLLINKSVKPLDIFTRLKRSLEISHCLRTECIREPEKSRVGENVSKTKVMKVKCYRWQHPCHSRVYWTWSPVKCSINRSLNIIWKCYHLWMYSMFNSLSFII